MYIGYTILFIGIIIGLWILAGRFEWKPTPSIVRIIRDSCPREEKQPEASVTLNIEALEFNHEDMEKEIYVIRKSRRSMIDGAEMNVRIETSEDIFGEEEIEKTKLRLEKRFPGLTVNFTRKEQGEKDAVLCND